MKMRVPNIIQVGSNSFEIKVRGELGEVLCRYPDDTSPVGYASFRVVVPPTRMAGEGVHNRWVVVANVANHKATIKLPGLRRPERERREPDDNADLDE
jgi:hypothetical protein